MKTSSLALLLALGPLTACAVDSAPPANDPVEATQASAIVGGAGTVGDVGDLPAEVDPSRTGPYAQGKLVRITSSELDYVLVNALVGTRLVLDTTGTSPTVVAPFYSCTYPNKRIREALTADCMERLGSDRVQCLKEMNAEYPNITQCGQSGAHFHSYIDFGSVAEAAGAQDIGFEDFRTITRDSAGPGSITVDINYVRTMVGVGTTQAWFSPEPGNKAAANISLTLDSNQPTIPCTHSVLGCPDIELTNMKIVASLSGIKPVYEDTSKLGFDTVGATFTFDRNLNNVPDGLATALVDVDAIIKNNVEANVKRALGFAASRSALNKALTELAVRKAKEKNGSIGIDRFYAAWPEGKDTIVVDYQPCPRMGCGIGGPGSPIKETTKKLTP